MISRLSLTTSVALAAVLLVGSVHAGDRAESFTLECKGKVVDATKFASLHVGDEVDWIYTVELTPTNGRFYHWDLKVIVNITGDYVEGTFLYLRESHLPSGYSTVEHINRADGQWSYKE